MLENGSLIAFLATTRPAECRSFFEEKLGLIYQGETPHSLIFDANGTMLRIDKVERHVPASNPAVGWEVSNIVNTARGLTEKGVPMLTVPGRTQDSDGIWARPDGTLMAWFKDPDGNILSLSEHAERA